MKLFLRLSIVSAITILQFSFINQAQAWGLRGHHTICEAATFLVKEAGLKGFVTFRPSTIGHLCNIPDIHWKDLTDTKIGNATHFIEAEPLGLKLEDLPLDLKQIVTDFTGKENKVKPGSTLKFIPDEMGTSWWRAEQLYKLATQDAANFKTFPLPANRKEEQDRDLAFNKAVFNMLINMGLMGHYVGDNGQPFHTTANYDGYDSGHGGIHSFYEEKCVGLQGPELLDRVVDQGRKMNQMNFVKGTNLLQRMKELSIVTHGEIKDVESLDKLKKPSTSTTDAKGVTLRTPAERVNDEMVCKSMSALIVKQMARSAALIAQLWDEAYIKNGKPNLAAYKNFQYPFTPGFVIPDYFELPPAPAPKPTPSPSPTPTSGK